MRHILVTTGFLALAALPLAADPATILYGLQDGTDWTTSSDPAITPATPFAIASAGKAFTAVAVLRLVDRGLMTVDDPVTSVLPPAPVARYPALEGVTLRHLLTMTSGLPDYYDDAFFQASLANPAKMQRPEAAVAHVADQPVLFPPGSDYNYSNTNYVLLGLVLEHVTGKDYATVVTEEVLSPAGLTDSFVYGSRPLPPDFAAGHPDRDLIRRYYSGEAFGDGGVIASARDVARFYNALIADDVLLSDEMQALMLQDSEGWGYGMGIEVELPIVGHSGGDFGYVSDVRMNLATQTVAVILVADEDGETGWAWDFVSD